MSLTLEQRRDINRKNARNSTGPKSEAGKARSRYNSTKHGMRSEVLPLPNEDPAIALERAFCWNDFYQPQSPAAQHLVNECVRATLLSDRVAHFHDHQLANQVRHAKSNWEQEQDDETQQHLALMEHEPARAVRLLKRTHYGCTTLLMRWEALKKQFEMAGHWEPSEADEAMRMVGCVPELDQLQASVDGFLICVMNALSTEPRNVSRILEICAPKNVPPVLKTMIDEERRPNLATARDWVRAVFNKELEDIRTLGKQWQERDFAARREAVDRATILTDETTARLFLRYHSESRNAFHRAYGNLIKTLERDATSESESDFEAETVSPNEADFGFEEMAMGEEMESPNEADFSPEEWAKLEEMEFPNEADFGVKGARDEAGIFGKMKSVVIGCMLIFLLFSSRIATAAASPNEADLSRTPKVNGWATDAFRARFPNEPTVFEFLTSRHGLVERPTAARAERSHFALGS